MALKISKALAAQMLQQVALKVDFGSGIPRLAIYGGAPPASLDVPVSSEPELVSFSLAVPVFDLPEETDAGIQMSALPIDSALAVQVGTAAWFRIYDGDGEGHVQGTVTLAAGGGEAIVGSLSTAIGVAVVVTSLTVRQRTE